jgi:hypothetical protein
LFVAERWQVDETAEMTDEERAVYQKYKPKTVDELKDFMRWNGQQVTGTKVRNRPLCPLLCLLSSLFRSNSSRDASMAN